MNKKITVLRIGFDEAFSLSITPDATAEDILDAVNLYTSHRLFSKDGLGMPLEDDANVYKAVEGGAKLFAVMPNDIFSEPKSHTNKRKTVEVLSES